MKVKEQVIPKIKEYAIWIVLIALFITFSLITKNFFKESNLFTVARQVSMFGIAAVGMTFVILIGGIDLSIGSIITLVNVVCAYLMVNLGFSIPAAILASMVVAVAIGALNGIMVAWIKMPAIIATFATQIIFEGVSYILCGGTPIYGFNEGFKVIGQGYLGPVPVPVIIMAVCFGVGAFILHKTYFGRYFYAVGGNEDASRLSGINVNRIKFLIYCLSGLFAGIAGIVMLSRTNSAQPTAGKGFEFDVITCVVLGGVSVAGGYGKIVNVIAGTMIIGILTNGMILMNVDTYLQMVMKGIVLILAVGFDSIQNSKMRSRS